MNQSKLNPHFIALILVLVAFLGCRESAPETELTFTDNKQSLPPNERFGDLFEAIQMEQIFSDSKTFVDCVPKVTTDEIMAKYTTVKEDEGFELGTFVKDHFDEPLQFTSGFESNTNASIDEHINSLWPVLTRTPDVSDNGSLIPLPHPYIVPGGRFGEIYYWDSYFTMLGLQAAGKTDMIEHMIQNFSHLIDTYGYIPNGNRTYFLTRSQPPFFAKMVTLLADIKGQDVLKTYLPQLQKEYDYWMRGSVDIDPAHSVDYQLVYLDEQTILNRYYDEGDYPRSESYKEDMETARNSSRSKKTVYQELRSACESGWDFSSRWMEDAHDLASTRIMDIIPIDLNVLLHHLELTLSIAYKLNGNDLMSSKMEQAAKLRGEGIQKYCWSEENGYFMDYNYLKGEHTNVISAAGMWALEMGIATPKQAAAAAQTLADKLLMPGGIVSTLNDNGQQWDYPNGWAPQQWMAISGLRKYGQIALADEIKKRWIDLNTNVYKRTGKLVEKYNVVDLSLEAGGGEYPVQDGFGWTNGVLLRLLSE